MTQEKKQLLLKDLYGRIPYGVKIATSRYQYGDISTPTGIVGDRCYFGNNPRYDGDCPIEDIKPYLRPMSSMTKEEIKEFRKNSNFEEREAYEVRANGENKIVILQADCDLSSKELDWLNDHYFDYRGLIEKGLALEAPEGMYKNKFKNG